MAVEVAPETSDRILSSREHFVVQVLCSSDEAASVAALRQARAEIMGLDGEWRSAGDRFPADSAGLISDVLSAPTGPFLVVDGKRFSDALLKAVPKIVARRLVLAGVDDALVAAPDGHGPIGDEAGVAAVPNAIVLRLYPPPPPAPAARRRAPLPTEVLDQAAYWLTSGHGDRRGWASVEDVEFPLALQDVAGFLKGGYGAQAVTSVVLSGRLSSTLRAVNGCFGGQVPYVAIAAGGPDATREQMAWFFRRLCELADSLADSVAYAFISIDTVFADFLRSLFLTSWARQGGAHPSTASLLCDERVFDAFPYQILGPGHIRRLGGVPLGAVPLQGERIGMVLGDISDWLPNAKKEAAVRERGRSQLARCLLTDDESHSLAVAKLRGP